MYRYTFDHNSGGSYRISQERYEIERDALRLLLKKVEEWNSIALEHGAGSEPYAAEAEDLRNLISFREERLNDKTMRLAVFTERVAIGSLRYVKAALLYSIRMQETELERRSPEWPAAVTDGVRARIQRFRDHVNGISHPPCDLFSELRLGFTATDSTEGGWDVFICHASEDKEGFVRPFALALREASLRVWYDEFTLSLGDSLRRSIDRGLARSRYGIVVLSPSFFAKDWPQRELDGLVSLEVKGRKVLPIWHNIDVNGVLAYSPLLADRVAGMTSQPMNELVESVLSVVGS